MPFKRILFLVYPLLDFFSNGFLGPDASYHTKKDILISTICFKK